ncbi:MAG: cbb3-type cytochrome oxidase assembly protein CcoS [Candidatus Devosia phytovorans]|uniref:Cbb3-type cytochrome oxidase assembly protein CcoS n=1 Tax=Candidatus Devosia phytovorans TaxID=3121372 RepID=A0AAJ5VZZ2_9HYPH|nr:cbb3-type cytochrome oxidase assembly protein CcoS [Devosia sp.]WEK06663.1 MAG: cbb3-type cytochrome oxidase assembly protein CcoS [Devosia sp.]
MSGLVVLILSAMGLGGLALAGFFWAVRAGQYDDIEGAAQRILLDDDKP